MDLKAGYVREDSEQAFSPLLPNLSTSQQLDLSYRMIVMLSIPFGIVGVIINFFLHDLFWKPMPLSFFSTIGMVALSGVVVNSALVLLVFIQRAMAESTDYLTAVMPTGRSPSQGEQSAGEKPPIAG